MVEPSFSDIPSILLPPSSSNINSLISDNLTVKGNIIIQNGIVTIAGTPTDNLDAVPKSFVDNLSQSVTWKNPVIAGTTGPITLSGIQTVDGILLSIGDRILVKDQASGIENGIYVVATGSWTRANDMATGSNASSSAMWIESGTINVDTAYLCTNNIGNDIVGTDSLTFVFFSSGSSDLSAGDGIDKTGMVLSVDSTVIRTTGGQIIGGAFDATGTIEAGTLTDGVLSITGGAFSIADLTVTNMLNSTGTNQILTSNLIDGTQGNINTQGDITLYNATKNTIFFKDTGSGVPSFTTRSNGTKIVLKPSISGSTADFAIGVDGDDMWFSVDDSTSSFRWGRLASAATSSILTGTGELTSQKTIFGLNGTITSTTFNWGINSTMTGGLVSLATGTVTQITSIVTSVTINEPTGVITTVSTTAGSGTVSTFTVNNTEVLSTSRVHLEITNYSGTYGTNGIPIITVSGLAANSFDINLLNVGSNALSGTLNISFFLF